MRSLKNTHGSAYFSSASFKNNANGWNDSLQNTYYHSPALIAPIEWLVQSKMTSPKVVKQQNNSYSILDTNPSSTLKQFALIQKTKAGYRVAAILPKETKSLNLNTLGITLSSSEPVWIVAVGKQNQLSKYQLLD
jgi:hypothetical protein